MIKTKSEVITPLFTMARAVVLELSEGKVCSVVQRMCFTDLLNQL